MFHDSTRDCNTAVVKPVNNQPATELAIDTYFTVAEVATFLKVHHTTIYRLIKRQGLPGFKIGADWRFSKRAIEEWLAARQRPK
jgi:excisionase family DNA binding protein